MHVHRPIDLTDQRVRWTRVIGGATIVAMLVGIVAVLWAIVAVVVTLVRG